ncbi:MAG: corrinoid protein [Ichthyobacteriaceae bacterium]|nr:corrinoid protein [Ichthyobacteriaceae bacterium]
MEILEKIAHCVEFGKINKKSPYPPNMRNEDGADEYVKEALDSGIEPNDVLKEGLMIGMNKIGVKFRANTVFVPQVLMSAKSMSVGMAHLRPHFISGAVQRKGKFIIGTIKGDLHDIGKNLVAMMLEGNGYEVIDLGVDVGADKFLEAQKQHPGSLIGMSALLTTTMTNMAEVIVELKKVDPTQKVFVGGAPLSQEFCDKINADYYAPDPQGVIEYANSLLQLAS